MMVYYEDCYVMLYTRGLVCDDHVMNMRTRIIMVTHVCMCVVRF